MKYFIYCRKSTDENNRQVQSIQAQETELREYAIKEGFDVVKVFRESKTAKEPGRQVFNEMLMEIEKGKAEGLLAWHPDRLARNSVDGGKIIFMMDQGLLKDLKFPTYWVDNNAQGKFTLSLAFGQSKYYIDNLSQNVKRGIREKLRRGEWPTWAMMHGYVNDKINKTVVPDPKVFPLIQRLFDEFAQGHYSIAEMAREAHTWGLKNKKGNPLTKSVVYRILKNPFYMGVMVYKGQRYPGKHKKAVNAGKFMQVQKVIEQRAKPEHFRKNKKTFPFTGLMTCGECGCSITAELQRKHTYYRCTKKKGTCSQKYVREEDLEKQVDKILKKISVDEDIFKGMIMSLKQAQKVDHETHIHGLKFWQNEQVKIEEKKKNLLDYLLDNKVTPAVYENKLAELEFELQDAKNNLLNLESTANTWLEQQKNLAIACFQAHLAFSKGDAKDKKLILHSVGSNFTLTGGNISWDWVKPFDLMAKSDTRSAWRRGRDSNPWSPVKGSTS
jgi:site-specific DNA recombinase